MPWPRPALPHQARLIMAGYSQGSGPHSQGVQEPKLRYWRVRVWGSRVRAHSCPTPYGPVDCSPPGSSVHGSFQARILERVAISFPRGSSWPSEQARYLQVGSLPPRHLGSLWGPTPPQRAWTFQPKLRILPSDLLEPSCTVPETLGPLQALL